MLDDLRRRRAAKRMRPGDGGALQRFRWWQLLRRSLFFLRPSRDATSPVEYAIDVRHGQDKETGDAVAHLYRDGRHHARSRTPAAFPVEGGVIEVATSAFGIKRLRYLTAEGTERQLVPDPASAEGRRARLDREHPTLSRGIGVVSVVFLFIGAGLLVLQLAEPISQIPPIAETLGLFESPLHLPAWLNVALTIGAILGSTERALRLRYNWLLDGAAN